MVILVFFGVEFYLHHPLGWLLGVLGLQVKADYVADIIIYERFLFILLSLDILLLDRLELREQLLRHCFLFRVPDDGHRNQV